MIDRFYLWAFFVLFMLVSCDRKDAGALLPDLVKAETLMYTHPDSALLILERMQTPSPSNRYQNATWCLLMMQARDKNNEKHTSDSLINIAYDYFAEQENSQRKALAANYQGRINEDMGNIEKATHYFLEASFEVEKTDDHQLAFLVYSNLGMIYLYRSLNEYAMPPFQKAYEHASLSENAEYISSSLSYIARVYAKQAKWDESIEYYEKAIEVAKKANKGRELTCGYCELSGIYTRIENYQFALEQIQKALLVNRKEYLATDQILLRIGDLYRFINKNDSANYYLQKAILSDNIYTVRSAYHALYLLNKEQQKYKEAIEYNDKYWIYSDSIKKSALSKEVVELQEKYNKEKLLNEKNQLQMEKDSTVRNSLLLLILLISILGVIIYVYQRKLIRKEHTIQKNEEQIRLCLLKIHKNELLINTNESRMQELALQIEENQDVQEQLEEQQNALLDIQRQNNDLHEENAQLQLSIGHYSKSLLEKAKELDTLKALSDEKNCSLEREKFLCNQLIRKTPVLDSLKRAPKYLDSGELYAVQEAINELFDSFTVRLSKQIPLSEDDLLLCCLLKLRLTNSEIGTILNITADSVSKRKQRIKARIIHEFGRDLGNKRTLDLFIWEF